MPNDFVTVFQVSRLAPDWPFACIGLIPITIGAVVIFGKRRFGWTKPNWLFAIFACGFGILWTLGAGNAVLRQHGKVYHAFKSGDYFLIEGTVTDFHPMPYEGHQDECFSVQDHRFCYSDYDSSPGFHQSASHGGPIREGMPIRVGYVGGTIVRLDIPPSFVLSKSEASAVEASQQQAYFHRSDADPFEQNLKFAFALAAFGLLILANRYWKPAMRLWIKPPYKPLTEKIFRVLFAVGLFSCLIQLFTEYRAQPLARDTVPKTLGFSVILFAFMITTILISLALSRRRDARQPK